MNRFHHTSNGETFIEELGMDVGFIIETDNNANQYVYVFYLDLKTDDYGLNESIKKKKYYTDRNRITKNHIRIN